MVRIDSGIIGKGLTAEDAETQRSAEEKLKNQPLRRIEARVAKKPRKKTRSILCVAL